MLNTLKIELKSDNDDKIKFCYGSLFHGWLMEQLDTNYVEFLHNLSVNPYSQFVYFDKQKDCYIWKISTLNQTAKEQIIDKLMTSKKRKIKLTHNNLEFSILSKTLLTEMSYEQIANKYFSENKCERFVKLHFLTPTTYKADGEYQIFPSISAVYTSVVKKWNEYSDNIKLDDKQAIEHIISHTKLADYKLKSVRFDMEGIKINSYIGELKLFIKGPEQLVKIANILLDFAKYTGIGAKTALGMGGIEDE